MALPAITLAALAAGRVRPTTWRNERAGKVSSSEPGGPSGLGWRRLFSELLGTFRPGLAEAGGALENAASQGVISRAGCAPKGHTLARMATTDTAVATQGAMEVAKRRSTHAVPVEHLPADQRAAKGGEPSVQKFRDRSTPVGRRRTGRRSPVELLEEQARSRIPELVPIRHGRVPVSPFTFFRGAAYLVAADLADLPRTRLLAQLCGDAHLSNFGVFAAPDRRMTFSVNDFDETLPGPFEWD